MKQTTAKQLSPYIITWAILRPLSGVATIADQRFINGKYCTTFKGLKVITKHFANIDKAKEWLSDTDFSRLSKPYKVTFVSDRQFGMASPSDGVFADDLATARQRQESVIIGQRSDIFIQHRPRPFPCRGFYKLEITRDEWRDHGITKPGYYTVNKHCDGLAGILCYTWLNIDDINRINNFFSK